MKMPLSNRPSTCARLADGLSFSKAGALHKSEVSLRVRPEQNSGPILEETSVKGSTG